MPAGSESRIIHSARRIDAGGILEDAWVLSRDGRVVGSGTGDDWRAHATADTDVWDAAGQTLVPGFIDLHAHGAGGAAYDDGPAAMRQGVAAHREHGTTRAVLSFVASPIPVLVDRLGEVAELAAVDPGVLGAHLEGPFLAEERRGAHDPDLLVAPSPEVVEELIEAGRGFLRQVTLAPERHGALDAIARFSAAGVVAAIGHTTADAALTARAGDAGATLLTHAFNAMNGIGHREPGPIVVAFDRPEFTLEIILDGVHVHPSVAALAFREAPGRIALVTDAMAAAGSADGDYRLGGLAVTVADGRAVLTGTETIAGSTLTQDVALRNAVELAGIDPVAAVTALTLTPARALGLGDRLGRLEPGFADDALLLDASWAISRVFPATFPV